MGLQVTKLEGDTEAVLHRNLADADAKELARNVLAGNKPGAVKVRLTPFVFDDENEEYVLDHANAYELPRESDPGDEQADEDEAPVEPKPKPAPKKPKGSK